MRILGLIITACTLFSSVARAELINTDWKVTGDEHSVFDTKSGKEWLSLSLTRGMTYNQVANQLGEGGQFEGWRLPTEDEVIQMISNSIIDDGVKQYSGYSTNSSTTYTSLFLAAFENHIGLHQKGSSESTTFSGIYTSMNITYKSRGVYTKDNAVTYYGMTAGVYLVSDGGLTLGSKVDPVLSNYRSAESVSAPLAFGAIGLMLAGIGASRRNTK